MLFSSKVPTRLRHALGLDGAIAYSISARFWAIVSNVVTVALMVRFLSPVEQGYYFTLISLVALQVVFELGFSFVILQHAAHERAHLRILPDGTVEGDGRAHARLASILQLTVRWYSRAGIALAVILVPTGIIFFSKSAAPHAQVHWMAPWLITAGASVIAFLFDPLYSFFEGCGEVKQIARMRFSQAMLASVCAWGVMLAHHGLYAPGLNLAMSPVVGTIFMWRRRRFLLGLLRYDAVEHAVSWRHEIFPFQWKIAVSWTCAYFTRQIFTPIVFHYRGAVEAGQIGMTISVAGYLSSIALSWINTKAPTFGLLVAQHQLAQLKQLFSRTLRHSMNFLFVMSGGFMIVVVLMERFVPQLAVRITGPWAFLLILVGTFGSVLVQSFAIYLRSFKREPFLWHSMTITILTLVLCRLTVVTWGNFGVSVAYLVSTGIVGSVWGWFIFRSWPMPGSRQELGTIPEAACSLKGSE